MDAVTESSAASSAAQVEPDFETEAGQHYSRLMGHDQPMSARREQALRLSKGATGRGSEATSTTAQFGDSSVPFHVSEPSFTGSPLRGPWEVVVNAHVFVDGLPTRDLARRIAASWNRQQRPGQPRFRARKSAEVGL